MSVTAPAMQNYRSTNLTKHTNPNPLQRWLLGRFHRVAADLLSQTGARTVLDAGCGEGFAMRYLFGDSPREVTGMDASVGALSLAHRLNPRRPFVAGDMFALPFPDRHFDLVLCMEVLEHLPGPDQGLAELCRVSRSWLLLSVPNEPLFRGANFLRGKNVHAWGNDPGHLNHWSSRAFLRFVSGRARVVEARRSFPWTLALCRVD